MEDLLLKEGAEDEESDFVKVLKRDLLLNNIKRGCKVIIQLKSKWYPAEAIKRYHSSASKGKLNVKKPQVSYDGKAG
jgi:hypothetical protein